MVHDDIFLWNTGVGVHCLRLAHPLFWVTGETHMFISCWALLLNGGLLVDVCDLCHGSQARRLESVVHLLLMCLNKQIECTDEVVRALVIICFVHTLSLDSPWLSI